MVSIKINVHRGIYLNIYLYIRYEHDMPAISARVEAKRCHSFERVTQELLEAAVDRLTSKLGTNMKI